MNPTELTVQDKPAKAGDLNQPVTPTQITSDQQQSPTSLKKKTRSRHTPEPEDPEASGRHHTRGSSISQLNLHSLDLEGQQSELDFHQRVNQILWPGYNRPGVASFDPDSTINDHSFADLVLETEAPLDSALRIATQTYHSKKYDGSVGIPDSEHLKFSRRLKLTENEINFGRLVDVCPRQAQSGQLDERREPTELPIEHLRRYLLGPDCSLLGI